MLSAPATPELGKHERDFASLLYSLGPLSRRDVVERTGTHPNLVGKAASNLLQMGIVRPYANNPQKTSALTAPPTPAGRPRAPLEIDPDTRQVLGISLQPGVVSAVTLNLLGQPTRPLLTRSTPLRGLAVLSAACDLLRELAAPSLLSIGVSIPGFIDTPTRKLLLSAISPDTRDLDLSPLYAAADDTPLLLSNDMHALAARWQLSPTAPAHPTRQDVLLAWVGDGAIGASLLFAGRPNRGCVMGAAELGHVRPPLTHLLPTPRCFCGRTGCLERIFSSSYLATGDLQTILASTPDPRSITTALAASLADAACLLRPHRIVIASPFAEFPLFQSTLTALFTRSLLPGLAGRIDLTFWPHPSQGTAETAGYLPLSSLYQGE